MASEIRRCALPPRTPRGSRCLASIHMEQRLRTESAPPQWSRLTAVGIGADWHDLGAAHGPCGVEDRRRLEPQLAGFSRVSASELAHFPEPGHFLGGGLIQQPDRL
jgi:hypothetical protein